MVSQNTTFVNTKLYIKIINFIIIHAQKPQAETAWGFSAFLSVKRGVERVEVLGVKMLLSSSYGIAETINMKH